MDLRWATHWPIKCIPLGADFWTLLSVLSGKSTAYVLETIHSKSYNFSKSEAFKPINRCLSYNIVSFSYHSWMITSVVDANSWLCNP